MAEVILNCPQCQRQLRVTEDLLGRPVRCPACGLTFTVPARSGQAEPVVPPPMTPEVPRPRPRPPEHAYGEEETRPRRRPRQEEYEEEEEEYEEARPRRRRPQPWDYESGDRERAKSLVLPPAIGLLVTGALGAVTFLGVAAAYLAIPDAMHRMNADNPFARGQQPPPPEVERAVYVAVGLIFGINSLVVLVAGVQMLRMRTYWLVLVGSILALLDGCSGLCCLLAWPSAIWSLVVLFKPEVKEAFH